MVQTYRYNTCIIVTVSMVVPANMSATLKKSYGQLHSFQILSTFLYDNFAGQLTGQHSTVAQHVYHVILFNSINY